VESSSIGHCGGAFDLGVDDSCHGSPPGNRHMREEYIKPGLSRSETLRRVKGVHIELVRVSCTEASFSRSRSGGQGIVIAIGVDITVSGKNWRNLPFVSFRGESLRAAHGVSQRKRESYDNGKYKEHIQSGRTPTCQGAIRAR
jgi:hypothetical protein